METHRLKSVLLENVSIRIYITVASEYKWMPLEVPVHSDELLNPRDAARALGISYPTLKQWIYKKKLHSIRTAGGHHRIPASEIERFLPRNEEKDMLAGRRNFRRISGRNQLVGRIVEVRYSGLL